MQVEEVLIHSNRKKDNERRHLKLAFIGNLVQEVAMAPMVVIVELLAMGVKVEILAYLVLQDDIFQPLLIVRSFLKVMVNML